MQLDAFRATIRAAIDLPDANLLVRIFAIYKILEDLELNKKSANLANVEAALENIIDYGREARIKSLQRKVTPLRDVDKMNDKRKEALARVLNTCSLKNFEAAC